MLPLLGARFQFLVRELITHTPLGMAKKQNKLNKKTKTFVRKRLY